MDERLKGGPFEQIPEVHILTQTREYAGLLRRSGIKDRIVTEVGVGTGVLTELILQCDPRQVIGFEILPNICRVTDPRFCLRLEDFFTANLSYLDATNTDHCFIANPPYSLLPHLQSILKRYVPQFNDVILMVRPKDLVLFPDFTVEFELSKTAFQPVPNGNRHLVIRRGFNS